MGREPLTLRRAIVSALLGALATGVLWTLLTGDVERGASFGGIALFVLLAWVILDQRRRALSGRRGRRASPRKSHAARTGTSRGGRRVCLHRRPLEQEGRAMTSSTDRARPGASVLPVVREVPLPPPDAGSAAAVPGSRAQTPPPVHPRLPRLQREPR